MAEPRNKEGSIMSEIRIECFQNEFLSRGAEVMNAVLTVTATGTGSPGAEATASVERSELLIVDTSGSMNGPKLRAAKEATCAAIDCIPDGVRFGLITGNHNAELVFPSRPGLADASAESRSAAKKAVKEFEAGGGTAMGSWIQLAADTFPQGPGIRHAILLTDGKNESEKPEVLDEILQSVEGAFQCDCRGVGNEWVVAELRKIATALVGTYDIVAKPDGLQSDFTAMMQGALRKQVAEVALRIWTPEKAEVTALKHMEEQLDLTGTRVDVEPRVGEYATGAWGDESRDYFLSVRVPPGEVGDEMMAARVTLTIGGEPGEQCRVLATWTDDVAKSTQMNRRVAQAMNTEELADAIQDVVDSMRIGDVDSATNRAVHVAQMARDAGNEEVLGNLSKLFDQDPVTGRYRPKPKVDDLDLQIFEVKSARTSRPKQG
jgi:hypothetical protein